MNYWYHCLYSIYLPTQLTNSLSLYLFYIPFLSPSITSFLYYIYLYEYISFWYLYVSFPSWFFLCHNLLGFVLALLPYKLFCDLSRFFSLKKKNYYSFSGPKRNNIFYVQIYINFFKECTMFNILCGFYFGGNI